MVALAEPGELPPGTAPAELAAGLADVLLSNHFRADLDRDPRADLRRLRLPVLAVTGTKDVQVDPEVHLPEIERAPRDAGARDVTIRRLAGLNHLFQRAVSGRPDEYSRLPDTFAPAAVEIVSSWIRARMGKSKEGGVGA